ncbi:hypothetical protein [Kineococcus sp. SYSU DK018]|uniref:hypothetical protein n=1 Tax=Kineococcus sp. SYSU DK018 TaxID=3383139 RepID=UPI003D7E6CC2
MSRDALSEGALRQRPFGAVAGWGLLRGALCGAALGVLPGIAVAGLGLRAGGDELELGLGLIAIGAVVGALCGVLAAAGSFAVLAVAERRERRRAWSWSVLAAAAAALVAVAVFTVSWWIAQGVLLPAVVVVPGALVSGAVALWQVRRLVRPLS